MLEFLQDHHDWLQALHIISVMAWMAGLFYLPRLYVYHAEGAPVGSKMSETFKVMERKLLRAIMNPAMVSTWVFGVLMLWSLGFDYIMIATWLQIKLVLVCAMTWFHHKLIVFRRDFDQDRNTRSGRTYRLWNEFPTLLMVFIVILAVVKPS
jgi:putative membrane protein